MNLENIRLKNIENFNNLGGVKMAEYKSTSSKSDFEKEKEEAFSKLQEIDKKYSKETFSPKEIQSLGLEKKEFNAPSEDEIKAEAENTLKDEKENERQKLESSFLNKFSKLEAKIEDAGDEKDESIEDAFKNYKSSLRKTTNSSIKQGISRSSIFNEAVKAIEGTKDEQISSAISEFNKNIERLSGEKEVLEMQKQNALDGFDISYAVKLENKIAKINSEISKQQKEVDNFNKEIDRKEKEYVAAQEKENSKEQKRVETHNKNLEKQIEKLGEDGVLNQMHSEKYDVVLNYLMKLPKEVALNELQKDNRYEMLLSNYYPAVYAQILNRKE